MRLTCLTRKVKRFFAKLKCYEQVGNEGMNYPVFNDKNILPKYKSSALYKNFKTIFIKLFANIIIEM